MIARWFGYLNQRSLHKVRGTAGDDTEKQDPEDAREWVSDNWHRNSRSELDDREERVGRRMPRPDI